MTLKRSSWGSSSSPCVFKEKLGESLSGTSHWVGKWTSWSRTSFQHLDCIIFLYKLQLIHGRQLSLPSSNILWGLLSRNLKQNRNTFKYFHLTPSGPSFIWLPNFSNPQCLTAAIIFLPLFGDEYLKWNLKDQWDLTKWEGKDWELSFQVKRRRAMNPSLLSESQRAEMIFEQL